jgi:protein-tyrosine phosphatase
LWVGLFCLWLIPEKPFESRERSREPKRLRLALAYLIAGATLALLGLLLGGWGWLLLWPAGALALVAAIYAVGDARRFHKADGRLSPPAFWLLLPYLAGAWINSRLWTWASPAPVPLPGGLLLGRIPTRRELKASGARSLVDLVAELPVDRAGIAYRAVPLLDLLAPSPEEIAAAVAAIDELSGERPTLLCCALGYGRSATVAVAWLLASGRAADLDEAIDQVRRVRSGIAISPAHRRQLAAWHESRRLRDAG